MSAQMENIPEDAPDAPELVARRTLDDLPERAGESRFALVFWTVDDDVEVDIAWKHVSPAGMTCQLVRVVVDQLLSTGLPAPLVVAMLRREVLDHVKDRLTDEELAQILAEHGEAGSDS